MKFKARNFGFFILILIFLNILAWITVFDLTRSPFLRVIFFDVGQGDAIFIETPQKHQILIDGGPTPAILEKLGQEMPFWDRSIDLIILTHPERDHLAGLIEILKRYRVESILWTGVLRNSSEFREWKNLIEEENNQGATVKIVQAGQKINCSSPSIKHCSIGILYPLENLEGKEVKDSNNTSIIAKLVFERVSFLFTGDIYKSIEKELLDEGIDLNSDVLKIPHHGSKTSSSNEFIREISPKIAVISSGRNNPYGHPNQETLETLNKYDIRILRTDEDGDIKIISDGESLTTKF